MVRENRSNDDTWTASWCRRNFKVWESSIDWGLTRDRNFRTFFTHSIIMESLGSSWSSKLTKNTTTNKEAKWWANDFHFSTVEPRKTNEKNISLETILSSDNSIYCIIDINGLIYFQNDNKRSIFCRSTTRVFSSMSLCVRWWCATESVWLHYQRTSSLESFTQR